MKTLRSWLWLLFILTVISSGIIILHDYLKPSNKFDLIFPELLIYLSWGLGLTTAIGAILYSFRTKQKYPAIILIIVAIPWLFPPLFLSYIGAVFLIIYYILIPYILIRTKHLDTNDNSDNIV
jgi:hypothetical protein